MATVAIDGLKTTCAAVTSRIDTGSYISSNVKPAFLAHPKLHILHAYLEEEICSMKANRHDMIACSL